MVGGKSIHNFPSIFNKTFDFRPFSIRKIRNRVTKAQDGIREIKNRVLKFQDGIRKTQNRVLKAQDGIRKIKNRALKAQGGFRKIQNRALKVPGSIRKTWKKIERKSIKGMDLGWGNKSHQKTSQLNNIMLY